MNRRVSLGAWGVIVAIASIGCSAEGEGEVLGRSVEATSTPVPIGGAMEVDLPDGLSLEATAIGAQGQLSINDRATIYGAISGMGLAVNVGTGLSVVGADARVGEVLGGGDVTLRDRALVARNVQAGGTFTRGSAAVVNGSISPHAPLRSNVNRSWLVGFSDSASNITLSSGQSQAPAPGTFGNVTVNAGAKLTLKAGTYNINSLKLEPQSTLKLDTSAGPVIVNVKNELIFRANVESRSSVAAKALFTYLGATLISVDAPFAGTLIAPNATIKLESLNGATHYGAFFGRNVEVHQGGNVQHTPFAHWSTLPFVNDGADPIAAVPARVTLGRDGASGVLTYTPDAGVFLDFANITVRKVTALPDGPIFDFGSNFRCAQRAGLTGLDCTDFSPATLKPLSLIYIRRPFSAALIAALTGDLRSIFRCNTDICPFSAAGLFRLSSSHPAVKRQLKWQVEGIGYDTSSDSIKSAYADWSDDPAVIPNKRDLLLGINDAARWLSRADRFDDFRGQPETALTATGDGGETEDDDTSQPRYFISYEDAWRLYIWWVSHNIALDGRREMPWKLEDLAAVDESMLAPLFDSTEMMHRRPVGDVGLGSTSHPNYHDLPWSTYHGASIIGKLVDG